MLRIVGRKMQPSQRVKVRLPAKVVESFYSSPEWRALMDGLIRLRGQRCEQCGRAHGRDGKPIRIFGDHIVELKDGGAPLDQANVMLRCGSCHTLKTNVERAKRYGLSGQTQR